jgi:hypothetical protein
MKGNILDSLTLRRILETLNESQRRWLVGREAVRLGRGGIQRMIEESGLSKPTILKGIRELQSTKSLVHEEGRVRRAGGGRKPVEEHDPEITRQLQAILDESTLGDPMSPLTWTSRSTYQIREYLKRAGHSVSEDTVQRRLRGMGYSLQANGKEKEGPLPREWDWQFRHLKETAKRFLAAGEPAISVDIRSKERIAEFKNSGQTWRENGKALKVSIHDFPSLAEGMAPLSGACDRHQNQHKVTVGVNHDTAEFAVTSIRRWWQHFGRRHFPAAHQLLICADCGGSSERRNRAWKLYLQQLSDETGLEIVVGVYPPGTCKWNKIEHRMLFFISMNWKGEPRMCFETAIDIISATNTQRGLKIKAAAEARIYETEVKITDQQIKELNLRHADLNPQWNYSLFPRKTAVENK